MEMKSSPATQFLNSLQIRPKKAKKMQIWGSMQSFFGLHSGLVYEPSLDAATHGIEFVPNQQPPIQIWA